MEQTKRRNTPADRWGRAFFGRENDFQVSYTPSSNGKYNIFLYGDIEDARQFQDAIEAMNDAGEDDLVVIHLSTNGGSTDATDTFISAMRRCRARVVVEASGGVHSAGTIILMNAPEYRLSENFNALIHNGSFGAWGAKSSDTKTQFEFQAEYMDRLAWSTYQGFLTDDEIEELIAGRDFWMGPEEWVDRWKRRQEFLKNENAAEESDEETTTVTVDEEDEA